LAVNRERLEYWRGVGAQPSHTLECLLKKIGPAEAVSSKAEEKS
jgi:ribosomal protein S16